MDTIIVTDNHKEWSFLGDFAKIVSATDYLSLPEYAHTKGLRIINLCQSYQHQSIGYYVSLLAHARNHKAIPSVHNIQDVLSNTLSKVISNDLENELQTSLQNIKGNLFVLSVYFGQNIAKCHNSLAKKLHGLFPIPLLRFTIEKKKTWKIKNLELLSIKDIPDNHLSFIKEAVGQYLHKKNFYQLKKKTRFHDLAILMDHNEHNPPSNKEAIELFINAGEECGLNVHIIDKNDIKSLAEFDALFIRATTAVNHYTYRAARLGTQENLVVIDDPQSIIKCSNKVYLAELLEHHQIATPKTIYLQKWSDDTTKELPYPCILKRPDSAFSQGVIKISDEKVLQKNLNQFFKYSDLLIAQAFIPTEFDWRIGIIDNQPIYACKYFMANNHWQIYNWDVAPELLHTQSQEYTGKHETVPLTEVPEDIIKTALKCTKLIGNGLYGVDIKYYEGKPMVIEINDNPNIDFGIEDEIIGPMLYQQIMQVFLQRIRKKHGY